MNIKKIGSIAVLSILMIAAGSMIVAAVPQIPESYWGYAILDGELAPIGTVITVEEYDTGQVVGSYTIKYGGIYAGIYAMKVMIDDPESKDRDEGANNGDPLTWKLNGVECSTPAPGTDTAESGKSNNNFPLVAHHSIKGDKKPPTVTAELIPIDVEENEGIFKVSYEVSDKRDADPTVIAVIETPTIEDQKIKLKVKDEVMLKFDLEEEKIEIQGPEPEMIELQIQCFGGIPVENGQIIYVEVVDDSVYEYKYKDDVLTIKAPMITLKVTATDAMGNSATVSANPTFAPEEE